MFIVEGQLRGGLCRTRACRRTRNEADGFVPPQDGPLWVSAQPLRALLPFLLFGVLLAGTSSSAVAEQSPSESFRESVTVTLVEVPVTVLARDGTPVRGLTAGDFRISDEGHARPVRHFEVVDAARLSGSAPVPAAARLHVVLLFDLSNSSPGNIERVREAAVSFVRNQLRPFDLASVATWSGEHGFNVLTSFTSDRDLLALAIDTLGHPSYFKVADPLLLSAIGAETTGQQALESRRSEVLDEMAQASRDVDAIQREQHDQYLRQRLRAQMDSFGSFARMLDSIHGRKQVILLSEGFDPKLVQGKRGSTDSAMEQLEATVSGQPWRVNSDERWGFTETNNDLTRMGDLFRRSDVVLQAIDIKGLRSDVDARGGYSPVSNESLFLMTHPTGGEVFKNANDLRRSFEHLIEQQEVVYVLGFEAPVGSRPGSFHDLTVNVDKPGVRVGHRAGYYEPSGHVSPLEKTLTTAEILLNDLGGNDLDLSMLAVPFLLPDGEWKVPVILEMPGSALLQGVEGDQLTAQIYVYGFDPQGAIRDFLHQQITLDLSRVRETVRQRGIKFYGTLRFLPGSYSVKALVRVDQSDRTGFLRRDLDVGDGAAPRLLPPLLLEDTGGWVMVKAPPRTADEAIYPFHLGDRSFIPAAGARVDAGRQYEVALFAYNMGDPEQIRAGVRAADGSSTPAALSVVGRVATEGVEASKLLMKLDTTGLSPGEYSLEFVLTPPADPIPRSCALPLVVTAPDSPDGKSPRREY